MADQDSQSHEGGTYGSSAAAEGWQRSAAARAEILGPITERMLDLAGIEAGSRVLDVAAGSGEQTLLAARRVGPGGYVLATDVAARMLAGAVEAARQAGLTNIETRVMDARSLDLDPESFDAAISRLALMLIPQRERALNRIRRALKPGKRFATIVVSTVEKSPRLALPLAIAGRRAGLPSKPFEDPGMFALGEPGVLLAAYERAGFRDVVVEATTVERRFPTLALAVQHCRDVLPEVAQLMADLSVSEQDAAWAEVEGAFRQFQEPRGIVLPQEYLVGVGTK